MDLAEALEVLHLPAGTTMAEVRVAYRALVRTAHPDVRAPGSDPAAATARTAQITNAFAVVRRAVIEADGDAVPEPPAPPPPPTSASARAGGGTRAWEIDQVEADAEGDTIAIAAPASEAYSLLVEAGGQIGSIGYVDRRLGILELIVRFEGGPTCSVLINLQGRAFGTDAFCTMESIESAPTPALRPVVEALVEELRRPR